MTTLEMTAHVSSPSRQLLARMAAAFYLLTFAAGIYALLFTPGRLIANLIAAGSYVVVTVLFYQIFKPVSRSLSAFAALLSLAGCANGLLAAFHLLPFRINSLVFFGFYCLLIGYLVYSSAFLPRVLGVLMALGGVSWLTFASPALAQQLYPWNLAPGIVGEGALTLWLLIAGVSYRRA
jgi:hypothetical protein